MAVTNPRTRSWSPGRVPNRLLALGLALTLAVGGGYAVIKGNPFAQNQAVPTYQTAVATQGNVVVAVSATGPITLPASVPLSFKTSGKLSEIDVSVGQTVTAGQVLAREDTTDLQAAVDQAQATPGAAASQSGQDCRGRDTRSHRRCPGPGQRRADDARQRAEKSGCDAGQRRHHDRQRPGGRELGRGDAQLRAEDPGANPGSG